MILATFALALVLGLALLRTIFHSQGWMVMAAGLDAYGLQGAVRTKAVTIAYLETMRVWLEDEEPGLAKTMAALDKALRSAERRLRRLAFLARFLPGGAGSKRRADPSAEKSGDSATAGTA